MSDEKSLNLKNFNLSFFKNFKEIKERDLKDLDTNAKKIFKFFAGDDNTLQSGEAQKMLEELTNGKTIFDFNDDKIAQIEKQQNIKIEKEALTHLFSTIFPFLNEIKNIDKVVNNSAINEDEKLVLKNNAINLIQENLSEATKIFNSQNLGAITSAYDEHKNEDDKLKTSNVKKVLDYQEQGMHFLIEARDERLTKRDYYLKNKEHLKEMLITRINVLNIQDSLEFWNSTGKKLSKEDVIDAVDSYIDHICKNLELNKLKELQKGFVSYSTTRETEILKDFIQKAVEEKDLNSNTSQLLIEGRGRKLKIDGQTIPEYWDSDETISFEEVYKFERGVEYSPEKIKNYMCAKTTMEIVIKAHNQKQQFEKEINLLKDNKTLTTQQKIEKLQNLYEEIYAVQEGLADKKLAQLVKQSNSLIKYTNNTLNFSAYPNEEARQKALNKLFDVAMKEKEKEFTSFMKNKSIDDYQNILEDANNEALGKENAMLLATAMKNDNMTIIDRYTGNAAMTGVGLSIVGGILCCTPLAPLGAGMVTVGNTVALTSMGTSAVAEIADYKTKDFVTEEDTTKLIDGLIMDAGGMVIGYGAGKVGIKAFNKLIDKKLAATLGTNFKNGNRIEALKMVISNPNNLKNFLTAGGVKISSDFLISYIGDLAISGVLDTDDDWESLLRANLIGIVVGTSNDLKAATGAKFKIHKSKSNNNIQTKTTTSDLKKENIVENLEEAEKNFDSKKVKTQELNTDELEPKSNNTVPIDNLIKRYDEILKKATPTEEEILEFKNIQNELIGCGIFKPESKFTDIWESLKTNQFYQKYINPEFADFKALLNDTFKMIKENGFKIYKNKLNKQHLLLIFTAVITAPIPVPGTHLIAYILANKATKASSAKLNKLLEKARNAYQRYIKNPKPILETELNKACEEFTEEAFKHLDENYKVKENESHNTWLDENIDKLKESCQYSDDTGNLVERTLGKISSHLIQVSRFKILNYFIKNETLSKNKNLQKNTEYGATELEHLLMSVYSVQESKNIIDGFKYYISHENLHKNEIVQQYLNIILLNKNLSIEAKTKIFDLLSNPENSEILSKKASSLKHLLSYCDKQTDLDFAITVLLDKKANLQGLFNQAFNSINSKKELKDLYLNNKDNLAFTQELDKLAYYINDDNYQIAKPLINSKNIDIESKKNILKSTNEKNLEIAILLCNDKEFPKEHVAAILDKTTIDNLETAKELILDKNIPRDEIAVQLRIKNLNISNDEKNNIKEFLHNIKPYITKFSSNNNFMVQYLIDNPKISFADLNKYFNSINFKDLANKYPRIKNYTENELIQFLTYHYKCGTTKFTDSELTLTNDFTKFIAENYISANDMTELLTVFPNTDRNIGTLPKGWNEDSAKDKALQHEISNIFEEFRLTGDTNTRNIDKLQKDLSNLLHKQVKVSYLGAGMFGTAYKISIEGAEDVCLKIFHTVPDREDPLHGKYIEPQALTFLNNHSNKFVKMFFGKVGASQDNDSFLVTQFLSDDTVPIDTYKGENSKVRINMLDRNPYNEVKNKIIDPGGVDVLNEDVSAPKKAIEKAYNLKMNK